MKKKPETIDDLEKTVDTPNDIQPITTEYETTTIYDIDAEYEWEPELIAHKAGKWDRIKMSLLSGSTFDFLRHFIIGFAGVGGTVVATTGNLAWACIAGVGGGLVEGGRKIWSVKTARRNGGTKNRVLLKLVELIVALLEWWINRRKEAKDG